MLLGAGSSISQKNQEIISQESATTQTKEDDVVTATSVSSRTTVVLQTATALARGEHGTEEVEFVYYSTVAVRGHTSPVNLRKG